MTDNNTSQEHEKEGGRVIHTKVCWKSPIFEKNG